MSVFKEDWIPLSALETIAKIKSDSKQMEAFERFLNNEIDAKTIKMEYLSDKTKLKDNLISFNEKKRIVSINLSQYKNKDEVIKAFTAFINEKLS